MTKDLIKFENEEFPISYKAAEVDFQGYEALDAKVDAMTKDWDKYVVTAESYPYDKKTRAEQVIANKANEYTKPAMTASPYLQMLDYKSLPDVLTQMDNDHEYLIKQAKQQEENRKKAIESLEQHGDKYVDAKTGEVVDKVHTVTLKLTGTTDQLTTLSNFIRDWGISYERVN